MSALSLQTEPLDLAELAEACEASGLYAAASARGLSVCIPGKRKRCRWKGTREHGFLLVLFRDAARVVAPGSFSRPDPRNVSEVAPLLEVHLRTIVGTSLYPRVVSTHRGQTETECWARALVALYRAGLLPKRGQA